MSDLSQHSEWLSLIEVSGPFLAEPVLKDAFPQGLEGLDGAKKKLVRQAYDEWREAVDLDDPDALKVHRAWIELVLRQGLELDEDGLGDVLKHADDLPEVKRELPEHGLTLTPDFAVVDGQSASPLMLIAVYDPQIVLSEAFSQGTWSASPGERMVELCRATGVRLGLVTNGEQWMFVDAPVGAVTTFASWYGRLWAQEPITLQAFVSLLGIRRFFVDRSEQLPALLDNSLKYQDEVTDALGEQVRRAVEVLIQALDRAHVDSNRTLLEGVEPTELYEAGLTVMMRIVFLLSAEERGLLLLGDELYETNYAVSTLRVQLRAESEEILERRWDAWSRLLSLFRAVYGGIDHEALRLPALGGSLFDPDRFPFLEGRPPGSRWEVDMARPLPIDNRTVLLLLEAVQLLRGRALSYMALDVEQIGYVYEGLLERTVVRATDVTLDLDATKSAKNPWVTLPEIDDAAATGRTAVEELFKERTGSSASRIRNDLDRPTDDAAADRLLTACHADRALRDRVKPYFHLVRTDPWGYPLVYPKGTFMVTVGADRRETGAHYTPKSLTEAIVAQTLEPIAYIGPSVGAPRQDWKLRSAAELLELKICDPAMGSGAFLVQVCRWLSDRLVEAWSDAEKNGKLIRATGEVVEELGSSEPLRSDLEERLLIARRLVAERCLYGVDLNPLAVELAKLSIWLVTLAKGRPFGFLDHNLRCGDSLLGIKNLRQLHTLEINPASASTKKLFANKIDGAIDEALALREEIRRHPIRDIQDVDAMASLDIEVRRKLMLPHLAADALVGDVFFSGRQTPGADLAIAVGDALETANASALAARVNGTLDDHGKRRRPFHWPLEFPEVLNRAEGGFDAMLGNPPFIGGRRMRNALGDRFMDWLQIEWPHCSLNADLCVFFYLTTGKLVREGGAIGFLGTKTIGQGDTARTGLAFLTETMDFDITLARSAFEWPGSAAVIAALFVAYRGQWVGGRTLDGQPVSSISPVLDDEGAWGEAKVITANKSKSFQGSVLVGKGFVLSHDEAKQYLVERPANAEVVKPYLGGDDLNTDPEQRASRWAIDFRDKSLGECEDRWPELVSRIRELVKPHRDKAARKPHREFWWQHGDKRPALYKCIEGRDEVLVIARVPKYVAFVRVPTAQVFQDMVYVFDLPTWSSFSVLQSSFHDAWVRRGSSTVGETLRYTPSDYFDTFPFLDIQSTDLDEIGHYYHQHRKELMLANNEGLTATYNRVHDSSDVTEGIRRLRELRVEMDNKVAHAYGWTDLDLAHGFHDTKQGLRFTISDKARRDVLKRLVIRNKEEVAREREDTKKNTRGHGVGKKRSGEGVTIDLPWFGSSD